MTEHCDWYWGSHGCDLPLGHSGAIHHCGGTDETVHYEDENYPCSEYNSVTGQIRFGGIGDDDTFDSWSEWNGNGWAGFRMKRSK